MRTKTFLACGTASIALAGLLSVTPAQASEHPSTPAERAQTDALNAAQLNAATPQAAMEVNHAAPSQGVIPLVSVANASALSNAGVQASDGQTVGVVHKIVVADNGKPQSVEVVLTGRDSKTVAISADQLSYDTAHNILIAQLDASQIGALPATPQG